ncbi:MAG: hypothetical protein LC802_15900 [Acidobacteria bacterium]|nr:hypothetical protein [Acidobacteriota bacterium]
MATDDSDADGSNGGAQDGESEQEGGEASADEEFTRTSGDCPPEVAAQFWQSVAAYEQAPLTTHFRQLEEAGVELPDPEAINDQRLTAKLWEMIEALARRRVFLGQTDHLSDRGLYTLLWRELLREPVKDMPLDESAAWHIDITGSGSEEDTYLYLKYYADEETRQCWAADFPDDGMPEHAEPPFGRDRYLPQAKTVAQTDAEGGEVM